MSSTETTILLNYNSIVNSPVYKKMVYELTKNKTLNEKDVRNHVYHKIRREIGHITKDDLIVADSKICSCLTRKYYGFKLNYEKKEYFHYITPTMVCLFSERNGCYVLNYVVFKEEYDYVIANIDKKCCLATRHFIENLKKRKLGKLKNLIQGNLSNNEIEKITVEYINDIKNSLIQIDLVGHYKMVNYLNNNMENSVYYTDNKLVFVVANKVLITCYAYWADKYTVIE